jgi:hypothetical protein
VTLQARATLFHLTSNISLLIKNIKYKLIIKLATQIEAISRDESIKPN